MSIETLITNLISAIEANTAAISAKQSVTNSSVGETKTDAKGDTKTDTKATKGAKGAKGAANKAKEQVHTPEELKALLGKIRQDHGIEVAKPILPELGYANSAAVPADKIDEVYAAVEAKIEELNGDSGEEGDDL